LKKMFGSQQRSNLGLWSGK